MARYISLLKKQDAPKDYQYDDFDLYEATDAIRYITYAICGENDQFELDALMMALAEAYSETKGLGDHEGQIDVILTDFERRLRTSFEVHDQSLEEAMQSGLYPDPPETDVEDDPDPESDAEDVEDIEDEEPNSNVWTSYEDAVLVRMLDDDEYIVCPEPNIASVMCPCNPKPGFCRKDVAEMGYIDPEDRGLIESVTIRKVPVRNSRQPYGRYDIIFKDFPETIEYDG